jgi:caffeoyl-CoA O-methyltransferase
VITLELREDRAGQARDFFARAGVADRVELIEGDARESIETVQGPIDLLFVDAAKDEYRTYIDLAEPKLSERAVLVVDNMLMSGEVALPEGTSGGWPPESLAAARELNAELLASDRWLACVLPVGDGIAFATRR